MARRKRKVQRVIGTNKKNYNSPTGLPMTLLTFEPDMDLAVITDNEKFWAFVRRDPKTECFYRDK